MSKFKVFFSIAAVIMLLTVSARADELDEENKLSLEEEHKLSLGLVTPHTKWAKPYAQGTVRVLFFARFRDGLTYSREIIELIQRFDIKADAAYYDVRGKKWLGDDEGQKRILKLLQKPYDVYVFSSVNPSLLTDEAKQKVLEAVNQGAGIVLIGTKDADLLESGSSVKELPSGLSQGSCCTSGKGRVIYLPQRNELGYRVGWDVDFDYQMAQQGRALLWAADRSPKMALEVKIANPEIQRAALPAKVVTVNWKQAKPKTRLKVRLRRNDGHEIFLGSVDCSSDAKTARFELPVLRASDYHVDAFAAAEGAIESWATAPFTVTSARKVKAVKLSKTWGEIGTKITAQVVLEGKAAVKDRLRVQLIDRRGRILTRKDLRPKVNYVPVSFKIEPWLPSLLRVEAVIVDKDGQVASNYSYFRVTRRNRGKFNFLVWGFPRGDMAPYAIESMAKSGTTAILGRAPEPPMLLSAYDIAYVPYTIWLGADFFTLATSLDEKGVMKKQGCYNDKAKIQQLVKSTVKKYKPARQHGVLAYSLGDEVAVRGSCLTPYCLRAYQRYLRKIYGNINALNNQWGTDFRNFEQVSLSGADNLPAENAPQWFKTYYKERLDLYKEIYKYKTPPTQTQIKNADKNDEIPSLQAENYSRWYDRQAFQCYNLVQLVKRFAEGFRRIDPHALTGFEGTNSFSIPKHPARIRHGGDIDLMIREFDWWGPYMWQQEDELLPSLVRPGFIWGHWIGYRKDAETLIKRYWRILRHSAPMVMWWKWDGVGQYHGLLAPHLGPYDSRRQMVEDSKVVRDGLGTLLTKSQMLDDGIAMLYSMPSTYIIHFDGNAAYGNYLSPSA